MKNVLAVLAGIVLGGLVNMALISVGAGIIPPPEGVDPSDMESLEASMHLFEPRHFVFPFLAHALGTLVGAFIAGLLARTHKLGFALAIGAFFLAGGIAMSLMLPAPTWYIVVDLVLAYIPMAWIGGRLVARKR